MAQCKLKEEQKPCSKFNNSMKSFKYNIHRVMRNLAEPVLWNYKARHHIVKSDKKGQVPKNNKEAHISQVLMFVIVFSNAGDFVCKTNCSDQPTP